MAMERMSKLFIIEFAASASQETGGVR